MQVLSEVKMWIETNSTFVQAISSIASVLIIFFTLLFTIIYVKATLRLVHIPYKSFIKPIAISSGKNDHWFLKVINYGPGLAIDVKVSGFRYKIIKKESNPKDVYQYKEIIVAKGLSEIKNQSETSYLFPFQLCFDEPIIIKWRSITGKSYNAVWFRTECWDDVFEQQNMTGKIKYFFKMVIYYLKLPFVKFRINNYLEYNYMKLKILDRLSNGKSTTYDYIADESVRDDEEIKIILSKMKKQGLVIFDGEKAEITDKGRNFIKH